MPINRAGQVTDDENASPGDPNMVGPQKTQPVQDRRAGPMSPTCEYGDLDTYQGTLFSRDK